MKKYLVIRDGESTSLHKRGETYEAEVKTISNKSLVLLPLGCNYSIEFKVNIYGKYLNPLWTLIIEDGEDEMKSNSCSLGSALDIKTVVTVDGTDIKLLDVKGVLNCIKKEQNSIVQLQDVLITVTCVAVTRMIETHKANISFFVSELDSREE